MLDLSLAFPLPPFVEMCFKFCFVGPIFNEERHKNKQIILVSLKCQLSMPLEALDGGGPNFWL